LNKKGEDRKMRQCINDRLDSVAQKYGLDPKIDLASSWFVFPKSRTKPRMDLLAARTTRYTQEEDHRISSPRFGS
jgi:hypothetical protein